MKPLSSSSCMNLVSTNSSGLASLALGSSLTIASRMVWIPGREGYCLHGETSSPPFLFLGFGLEGLHQYNNSPLTVRLRQVNSLDLGCHIRSPHIGVLA